MKKIIITVAFCLICTLASAQWGLARRNVDIPDILGYKTLKCDFHIHTVFSDGSIYPNIRVDDAYCEGLDVIAITDHLEFRRHSDELKGDRNRSYQIAAQRNRQFGKPLILIQGTEITQGTMPPGHFNALFIKDAEAIYDESYMSELHKAKEQGAFIVWNHPGWTPQQPEEVCWFIEHTEIFESGLMQGIEVVNNHEYYPEAQQWAMEKNLTMLGNSDVHVSSTIAYAIAQGRHRPMTLVFAQNRTTNAVMEALSAGRTAVYFNDLIIGREEYLKAIFEASVEILSVKFTDNKIVLVVRNLSQLPFVLRKAKEHDKSLGYVWDMEIKPYSLHTLTIQTTERKKSATLDFVVTNLYSSPSEGMAYSLTLTDKDSEER